MVLSVKELSDEAYFRDVSLEVRSGEIVGVAGVLGSGKSELGRAIFGASKVTRGEIGYLGRNLGSGDSILNLARDGIGYVSPERKEDGLLDTFSVAANISFARIATGNSAFVDLQREASEASEFIARLRIKTFSPSAPVLSLSGGNQQKVILARWLARGVKLLILDNPTRGVDAGAKEQVYDLLRELAADGVAILLISDDLLEVIGLSNRIVVMRDGVISNQLDAFQTSKPSEATLVSKMV